MNKIWNLYCGVSYELYNFSSATCVKSMIIFIIHCVGMAVLESDVLDDFRLQMFILFFCQDITGGRRSASLDVRMVACVWQTDSANALRDTREPCVKIVSSAI